jgi:ABC-type multidrug transport system fused ATPase/permease subunit
VLYVVLAASLFQLFILANSANYRGAMSFVLVAAVMFYFSKNMVVVLVSALAVSAIIGIIPGFSYPKGKEGMEDASEDDDSDDKPSKKNTKAKESMEDSKVISDLKKDGESLIKTQEIIMNNFKKISPELDKVESLVASMNDTAATLNDPKIKEKLAASMLKP